MNTSDYVTPFLPHGIDISLEDQAILNHWHETQPVSDGYAVPKLISFEESMEYDGFIQDILPGFPGGESVILWGTEHISAVVGYYYTGPLKGTLYVLHGSTDISPRFLSLARFYDYYRRILRDYTDHGHPDYDEKFWRDIDFNDNQPLTAEETERFHLAARELMTFWNRENLQEEWYENLAFCIIAILPDCYAGELIPYIRKKEDEYVLEALCHKLVRARCIEAIPAMEKLAEAEEKGLRIGGWSDSQTARRTLASLLQIADSN